MNTTNTIKITTALFCLLTTQITWADFENKISKQLKIDLDSKETIELYVTLKNQHKVRSISHNNRNLQLQNSIHQLKNNASISQNNIKTLLASLTNEYKFYWINNSFWARLSSKNAKVLLESNEIFKAYSNQSQRLKAIKSPPHSKSINAIEWNINLINAPQVWNQGFKGENVIIAGQDTGYEWNHASIRNKYAGWDGSNVDHNYHWHDSISNPNIDCLDNQNNPASCDDHGHGTHTMGTMVGDEGRDGNQVGVAPDAKWIGCRNMDQGVGTPATYTECFQFFIEPTDLNGENPDASRAPHVINNSWGCDASEGCTQPGILESVVNNVVNAGILVVASAGNSGPGCNSVETPAAIYSKSLTIGSTTSSDQISSFSSQGAVTVDGSNRIKPDIVAPGSSIRSANLGGGYTLKSGTSMAGPHVAGVAALMISANPTMAGKPKILKQVLLRTSLALTSQQTCSGILGSSRPNNTFGWGRIDALEAVNQIKDIIYLDNFADF